MRSTLLRLAVGSAAVSMALSHVTPMSVQAATPVYCPNNIAAPRAAVAWWPTAAEFQQAAAIVEAMSNRELAGASVVVTYRGTNKVRTNAQSADNLRLLGKKQPSRAFSELKNAGVIYFRANAASAKAAYRESKAFNQVRPAWFINAVDQEGGVVNRLSGDIEPPVAAYMLGRKADRTEAKNAAFHSARQLRAAGIDVVFAPVADLQSSKTIASMRPRVLGNKPARVSDLIAGQVIGYASEGVMPVVKHFPGIGSIPADTHSKVATYPFDAKRLCTDDLAPFRAAIETGVPAIMLGHGIYKPFGNVPASGNAAIVTELLRKEMKFDGIIFTDSMTMKAAGAGLEGSQSRYVRSLNAGVDVLLMPGNPIQTVERITKELDIGNLSVADRRAAIIRVVAFNLAQERVAASRKKYPPGSEYLFVQAQFFALDYR